MNIDIKDEKFEEYCNKLIEIADNCVLCGLCRHACPIYEVLMTESYTPRSKNQQFMEIVKDKNKKLYEKQKEILFTNLMELAFRCSLCNNCSFRCPLGLDLKTVFKNFRHYLVKNGFEPKVHKEMIANVREKGNPFGDDSKGDKFYCC